MSPTSSDVRASRVEGDSAGQATVEFALMLPFFVVLIGCVIAVTAACLQVLALNDAARTTARLASVSADPATTAREWVADNLHGTSVVTSVGNGTVTVRLSRPLSVAVPLIGRIRLPAPFATDVTVALEPPGW